MVRRVWTFTCDRAGRAAICEADTGEGLNRQSHRSKLVRVYVHAFFARPRENPCSKRDNRLAAQLRSACRRITAITLRF